MRCCCRKCGDGDASPALPRRRHSVRAVLSAFLILLGSMLSVCDCPCGLLSDEFTQTSYEMK